MVLKAKLSNIFALTLGQHYISTMNSSMWFQVVSGQKMRVQLNYSPNT